MNYNSIEEIFAAGTTNMTVIRNNSKQDDGTDTITGVSWFTFNGTVASTIYVNGNSWIGFGSGKEHLKVNRRDAAMWYLYREEGTLYNYYNFLKIRWKGYSRYNYTTDAYAIEYDVILWDTGDISLHMITIPTSYNTGTCSLTASSTYSYTVSTSSPDVTFIKTDSGFEVNNAIISLTLPCERRYLIRSGNTYYTIISNALSPITNADISSTTFLNYGITTIPSISLLSALSNPEILYWTDNELGQINELIIEGTPPLPQLIYYESQNIPNNSGIKAMEADCSDEVLFTITFDGGTTWHYYNINTWENATTTTMGMTKQTLKGIPVSAWTEIATSSTYQIRCALTSKESYVNTLVAGHI